MSTYTALQVAITNGEHAANFVELETPTLAIGEVLIAVEYSSFNYKDALAITGEGKIMRNLPLVAGIDAAGKIIATEDKRFQVGDLVIVTGYELSQTADGGYAEYLKVPAGWAVPLPPTFSTHQAMTFGTAGFTAGLAIQRLLDNQQDIGMGPIVVTGASGGVGSIAIDCLTQMGFTVTALTSKATTQKKYLQTLGAKTIISPDKLSLPARPLEKALWGGAIDTVGGEILAWLAASTKNQGSIACCGLAASEALNMTVMPLILRGVNLLGINSASTPMLLRQKIWDRLASDFKPVHMDVIITDTVSLQDLPKLAKKMLAGQTHGRYVVKINP